MGRVIPFSEIESYLNSIEKLETIKGTILDTNVLVSASYDIHSSHPIVVDVWDLLVQKNYRLFATVNTRSEYLEFQRRLTLTENLFDMVDEFSKAKLPSKAKTRIQTLKGSLKTSVTMNPEKVEVFNESQLKKIKKEFSAGPHIDRGVEYISPHDESQRELFKTPVSWSRAINICEMTGPAFSDSMILNTANSSKLLFVVTLDFDIGFAALSDPSTKDVLVPDRLYREYRHFHFPSLASN